MEFEIDTLEGITILNLLTKIYQYDPALAHHLSTNLHEICKENPYEEELWNLADEIDTYLTGLQDEAETKRREANLLHALGY